MFVITLKEEACYQPAKKLVACLKVWRTGGLVHRLGRVGEFWVGESCLLVSPALA